MLHGFLPPARFLPYLSWTDIRDLPDPANTVILQPIGAIEQHGPHLPLAVDTAIATGVLGAALQRLPDLVPAYALPPLCYGKSTEHSGFPGTISLSAETLLHTLMAVGESLYSAGFRKLVFVNGHGGQPQVLEIAARDLRKRYPDFNLFPLFVWNVPHQIQDLLSPQELALGIHAGDAETSLMLALLPETVRGDRRVCEYPRGIPSDGLLSLEGRLPFAWLTRDLSQSGVIGDATTASLEKGQQILEQLSSGWVQIIEAIWRFQAPTAQGTD
jgi:creatinine amidohydrolase